MPATPNLRAIREAYPFSQIELAEKSGVTQTTISRLERGHSAQASTLRKLAKALRCKVAALTETSGNR